MNLRQFCLGVGLTSAASLALSLLFTRIFSVTMYYHFAFLLVSLALLGVALSGVAIYLMPGLFAAPRLLWLSGLFAVVMAPLAAYALFTAIKNPLSLELSGENLLRLVRLYFATGLPFLASGFALSLAIAGAGESIGEVYAYDLLGASVGCLAVIPLVEAVGAPRAVLVAGAAAALGGGLMAMAARPSRRVHLAIGGGAALAALGVGAVAFLPGDEGRFRFRQGTKFLQESGVEYERWNSFSRVTVSRGEADYKWVHIDADAATRMYSGDIARDGYEPPRRFSEVRVAAIVYALRREGPALIVGPGGGPDVVSALRARVPRIVGVEVNPLIARTIMQGAYAGWNGDLYRRPGVEVHVDDGRSFVRRSPERYSSIQATLVDTWAASSAGAFTLSENNLYTAEAFMDYLEHLRPDGVLSMTRWYGKPPVEFLRLLGLSREALSRLGIPDPQHAAHFYVAAESRMSTMLVKRTPFTAEEVAALDAETTAADLRTQYRPLGAPGTDLMLARYLRSKTGPLYAALPFDISPVTDNRPFFFYTLRAADFFSVLGRIGQLRNDNLGLRILQLLLLLSAGLTLSGVVLPLWIFRREALRERRRDKLRVLGYFICLGLGFILVELGLMQRFILFLGHPIFALAVVLATLLASSGLGSALSGRLHARYGIAGAIRRGVTFLGALLVVYALVLGPLFNLLLGMPLMARILVSATLVGFLGTFMGMLLPLGVRAANGLGGDLVPWAWGLNGAASVVGSILSLIVSMHFGFTATLLCGLGAYVVGAWVAGRAPT